MQPDVERWRAAVGRNASRYLKHFERQERAGGRWVIGWNCAAFLHSSGWFCYRRMYRAAALNFFAPLLLVIVAGFIGSLLFPGRNLDSAALLLGCAYLLAVFVLVPLFADSLYYRALKRGGEKAQPPSAGTLVAALLLVFGWLIQIAGIVNPMYADYVPRSRVSEGVSIASSLREPVTEFYQKQRRLPGPQEAAQFAHREPMRYAASVGWDASRRSIVVTMGMGYAYGGKKFEMIAEEKGGTLEWTCRPIDLERKYLPKVCRD